MLRALLILLLPLATSALAQGNTSTQTSTATAASSDAAAQTVTLKIREKGSGKGVRRAEVKWGSDKTFADRDGIAKVKLKESEKSVEVTITRTGYQDTKVELTDGETEKEVFMVSTKAVTTILVTGKDDGSPSKKQVSIDEARRVAPGGDPTNVVKVMPGVQVRRPFGPGGGGGGGFGGGGSRGAPASAPTVRTGNDQSGGRYIGAPSTINVSGIVVRGSPADDSRYYVDDFEVPLIYHGIIDLSIIPGGLLSDVQFDAGGFGSRYGNAGGGVIRLNTRNDIPESWSGEGVINLPFYAGIFYRTRLSDTQAVSVSFRRSYIDLFLNALLERQARRDGIGRFSIAPVAQDAHLMHAEKTSDGMRKIVVLYAEDGVKAAITQNYSKAAAQSISMNAYTRGLTVGVSQDGRVNDSTVYRTTPQYIYAKTYFGFSDNIIELTTNKVRVPTEFDVTLNETNTLTAGADPEYAWMKQKTTLSSIPGLPSSTLNIVQKNSFEVGNPAVWTAWKTKVSDLTLQPGLRGFYNTQIKKASVDPRLSAGYSLDEMNTLKSAVGQYSRAPTFDDASVQYGNPSLNFERTYHYILGVETRWNEAYTTDVQAFLKEAYDLVQSDRYEKYKNTGRREVYGFEVFARRNLTESFFGWVTYTYSKTIERVSDDKPFVRSSLDQTHVGNVVTSYRLNPTWELAGRYKYNTGGTYIPSKGGLYDTIRDSYTQIEQQDEANLPAQQSITFYATKDFLMDTWKLSLKFGMESFWFKPMVTGKRASYDRSKDTDQTGVSNIPFLELTGVH